MVRWDVTLKAASFDTLERLSQIFGMEVVDLLKKGDDKEPYREPQAIERKVVSLLKGYTLREQKALYQAMKYILRQNRTLAK